MPHNAIIEIRDYANNAVEIHAYFISDTLPIFDYSIDFQNNNCKVIFNENQSVRPHFFLTGEYHKDQIIPTEYSDIGKVSFSSTLFNEVLKANRGAKTSTMKVAKNGLAHVSFSDGEYTSNYYFVAVDEAN